MTIKKIENKEKTSVGKPKEEIKEEVKEKIEAEIVNGEKEDAGIKERNGEAVREQDERDKVDTYKWIPRTNLGERVKKGDIKDIDEILGKRKIFESEIIDRLLNLKTDVLLIGQAKGKFGGGKRRIWKQTQKKTAEGNIPTFSCMVVVGDEAGHVGLGHGKSAETLPAREKAIRDAKINLIKVKRGCGSFDCACGKEHSIPGQVKGKVGSSRMVLMPAPQGTGLVIEEECKKILRLAGIKDVYSKTFGQTRTKINLAKACIEALKKTNETFNKE